MQRTCMVWGILVRQKGTAPISFTDATSWPSFFAGTSTNLEQEILKFSLIPILFSHILTSKCRRWSRSLWRRNIPSPKLESRRAVLSPLWGSFLGLWPIWQPPLWRDRHSCARQSLPEPWPEKNQELSLLNYKIIVKIDSYLVGFQYFDRPQLVVFELGEKILNLEFEYLLASWIYQFIRPTLCQVLPEVFFVLLGSFLGPFDDSPRWLPLSKPSQNSIDVFSSD